MLRHCVVLYDVFNALNASKCLAACWKLSFGCNALKAVVVRVKHVAVQNFSADPGKIYFWKNCLWCSYASL